jgi:HD-GYP domain-containing protein (c-di-GMP phosphodiesterase class II)
LVITEAAAAAAFVAAAGVLAALGSSARAASPAVLALSVGAYLVAGRVRFAVGSAWTAPTQLVFVPMLFMLSPAQVPLIVAVCSVAEQLARAVHERLVPTRIFARVADASYSLGPALVFVAFGVNGFSWGRWPVFALALLAQIGVDASAGLGRTWFAERIAPSRQLPMLWLYITDGCLSCGGLVLAASAVHRPGLTLLALPLIGFVWLLGREREQRLDYALALSTAYRGTAALVGCVAEADDRFTGAHSREVVDLSRSTAAVLGLDAAQRRVLEFVAMLHDIGKIAIPKELLNKRAPLDANEHAIVRRCTLEGEEMLTQLGGALASVGPYVRACHEHYDGRGYPDGLWGEQIPIQSRTVSACHAFSAMTSDRPYRGAMPLSAALGELRRCAGSQFDPRW